MCSSRLHICLEIILVISLKITLHKAIAKICLTPTVVSNLDLRIKNAINSDERKFIKNIQINIHKFILYLALYINITHILIGILSMSSSPNE